MVENNYRYVIEMYRPDGSPLGQISPDVDWEPAAECGRLLGVRRGQLSPDTRRSVATIEPVWNAETGQPFVAGFRVIVAENGSAPAGCDVPLSYIAALVRRASGSLVGAGQLQAGEVFNYVVKAYSCRSGSVQAGPGGIVVESTRPALALKQLPLADCMARSVSAGACDELDMPAFIPRRVLAEAMTLTGQAGAVETGGVLIGHVRRDTDTPEVFLEVTAQVPLKHARGELTSLTFTPDTWAAVNAAVELRRQDELMVGWWHSHSYMKQICKDCEKQDDGSCKANAAFMSADDCALHRMCFPRAFSIALVMADSPCSGMTWACFGWRQGLISARGCRILDEARSTGDPAVDMEGVTNVTGTK